MTKREPPDLLNDGIALNRRSFESLRQLTSALLERLLEGRLSTH